MKVLILGASGFVGAALFDRLRAGGHDVLGTYRTSAPDGAESPLRRLDLTDERAAVKVLDEFAPDALVSLVAEPDVRKAESPEARADAAAVLRSLAALATECKRAERYVTLLSSDYVFDGRAGPYSEDDEPRPPSEYGRHKLASEEVVLTSGAPALVVRSSMVYGWPRPGGHPNFVANVVRSLRTGETVAAHSDVVRTPVYVGDLAGYVAELVTGRRTGLYHAGSSDAVSMFDFALRACETFDLDKAGVVAVRAAETDPSRPLRGGLKTQKIAAELRRPPAGTDEGLSRMKEEESTHA